MVEVEVAAGVGAKVVETEVEEVGAVGGEVCQEKEGEEGPREIEVERGTVMVLVPGIILMTMMGSMTHLLLEDPLVGDLDCFHHLEAVALAHLAGAFLIHHLAPQYHQVMGISVTEPLPLEEATILPQVGAVMEVLCHQKRGGMVDQVAPILTCTRQAKMAMVVVLALQVEDIVDLVSAVLLSVCSACAR